MAAALSLACAQQPYPIEVGALLPLSGEGASVGAVQRAALEASAQALRSAGITLELTLLDASPESTDDVTAQAAELIDGGAHVLICCNTPEEAAQLAPLATAAGVPLLTFAAPAAPSAAAGSAYWTFPLLAEETAALEWLLLESALQPVGLMAPVGRSGDRAEALLEPVSNGTERYPADPDAPLTPEALLLATREPVSVVLWDGGAGTLRAAEALAARGYEGNVIVRGGVWAELGALGRAGLTGAKSAVSPAVLGYTLADTHPSKAAVSSFRRALASLPDSLLSETTLAAGATAWDAALLIGSAAEQVLAYGLSAEVTGAEVTGAEVIGAEVIGAEATGAETTEADTLRRALRDALVGLGPTTGAGGRYDFGESGAGGLEPASLVLAVWRGGRFRPGP